VSELSKLLSSAAFTSGRGFDDLARYHVPFDVLVGGTDIERRLRRSLEHGGRVAVIGRSGAGKSSVLAWTLQPPAELGRLYAPMQLAIGGEREPGRLGDSRWLASLILGRSRGQLPE
jgi:hypothetical protein